MKLLFLTTQLPYPAHSGGTIKTFRLIRHFAERCKVTLLCHFKEKEEEHTDRLIEAVANLSVHGVSLNKQRSLSQLLHSYRTGKTLNEWRNFSPYMQRLVDRHVPENDLILVDHYELFQYINTHHTCPVVLHTHNAEFMLWKRYAQLCTNPMKKAVLHYESLRIRTSEVNACKRAQHIFAAPADVENLRQASGLGPDAFSQTYHLGDDQWLEYPPVQFSETRESIFFFGTLSWEANLDGLLWFITHVWPLLLLRQPVLTFFIIGKNPPVKLKQLAKKSERIAFTGFVENLEEYFTTNRVFINPVRFGSGIKVKMLDVLYRGLPAVTSRIGAESLDVEHGMQVLIASSPGQWVSCIETLLHQQSVWEHLRDNARLKAAEKYQWAPMLSAHWEKIEDLTKASKHAV